MSRWSWFLLALPLVWGCGGGQSSEPVAVPFNLVASTDAEDRVILSWQLAAGPQPDYLTVLRDGNPIARLPPDETTFEDHDAVRANIDVQDWSGEARPGAVDLSWSVEVRPGTAHVYSVTAGKAGSKARTSEPAVGYRQTPQHLATRIIRNGEEYVTLNAIERHFLDEDAGGWLNPPNVLVEPGAASVELAWSPAETGLENEAHVYQLYVLFDAGPAYETPPLRVELQAPRIEEYRLIRDGTLLDRLEPGQLRYSDASCPAGRFIPPELRLATVDERSIELTWDGFDAEPGETCSYSVVAVASGGLEAGTTPVDTFRLAPRLTGAEVLRDAVPIARLHEVDTGRFIDHTPKPGALAKPIVQARATTDSIMLTWEAGAPSSGPIHVYRLRFETDGGDGVESWTNTVSAAVAAPVLNGFVIRRDGELVAALDENSREWSDSEARPPLGFSAPLLLISDRTAARGVLLRWFEPSGVGHPHRYEVLPTSAAGAGPGTESVAARRPVPTEYEFQRDGGDWQRVDVTPDSDGMFEYLDTDAPLGAIHAVARVETHPVYWSVNFRLDAVEVSPPPASSYTVRGRSGSIVGDPSDLVQGGRATGEVFRYQWQRSEGDEDAHYADIPGQTRSAGFDDEALASPRLYRAQIELDGARGVSEAARAELDTFSSIVAFNDFNCALRTSDGRRRCWGGANAHGEAPIEASAESFESIALGESFGCGILQDDGRVVCWGKNDLGQAPSEPSSTRYQMIKASFTYACGIRTDGQVDCWGDLDPMQVPVQSDSDRFSDLALGQRHVCALREQDGRVVCWGANVVGEAPPGPSDQVFRQIDAGRQHTCGIVEEDGSILCWGSNLYRESTPSIAAPPARSIKLGHMHGCVVNAIDRKVYCWGFSDFGQVRGRFPTAETYVDVAAGFNHTCAIRESDGRVTCWGSNAGGQAPAPFEP